MFRVRKKNFSFKGDFSFPYPTCGRHIIPLPLLHPKRHLAPCILVRRGSGLLSQVQAVVLVWDKIQTEAKAETNKNQLTNKTQPKPNRSTFLNPNGDGISTGGALKQASVFVVIYSLENVTPDGWQDGCIWSACATAGGNLIRDRIRCL